MADNNLKANGKRTPIITTRLSSNDQARFLEMCKLENLTQTEMARRGIIEMLDRQEVGRTAEIENKLAERLKKMEDRVAALLARNNLDIGTVYQVLWLRSDPETKTKLFEQARRLATKRVSSRLQGGDLEVKSIINGTLNAEAAGQG